jgi:hypothetical protein
LIEITQNGHQATSGIADDQRTPYLDGLDRLEEVLAYTAVVLGRTDGVLVPEQTFQSLNSALVKVQDQVTENPQAADSFADEILDVVARLPISKDEDVAQAVKDVAAKFQRSAAQRLRALEADIGDARTDLTNVEGKLVEARNEVDSAFAERRAEADVVVTEMRNAIEEARSRIQSVETEQNELFRTAQDERNDTFRTQMEEVLQSFTQQRSEEAGQAEAVLNDMRRMQDQTKELVGVIGDLGTGGRYGIEVKAQKRQADIWRWITVGVVLGAAAVALWATRHAAEGIDDPLFVGKVLISVALGGLATYTAKQSSRHRRREESARALELDMAAFPPFIEQMGQDKRDAAREKMFDISFGRPLVPEDHRGDEGPSVAGGLWGRRARGTPTE